MSIESDIVDALVAKISAVPGIKTVKFDEIKIAFEEFQEHELPAVQIWDNGQIGKHQQRRLLVDWSISIELIMKSEIEGTVIQKDLFEKRREIQLAVFADPQLGVQGMTHLFYTGTVSDLHLLKPFYIARLDIVAQYYDALVGDC